MLSSIFQSGIASPGIGEKKCVHFNEQVERCIALDMEGDDEEEPEVYGVIEKEESGGSVELLRSARLGVCSTSAMDSRTTRSATSLMAGTPLES